MQERDLNWNSSSGGTQEYQSSKGSRDAGVVAPEIISGTRMTSLRCGALFQFEWINGEP